MSNKIQHIDLMQLPENWSWVSIEDATDNYNSKRVPLNGMEREKMKGIYPYCGANGIVDFIDKFLFDGEFILVAEDGGYWGKNQNTSYLMNGKFWVNNHAHILQSKNTEKLSNQFISFAINFMDYDQFITGDARGKLTKALLNTLKFPKPTPGEVSKITYVLFTVQKAIQKQEQIINSTTALKKSLLNKLFNEGTKGEPLKQTEIGTIPESWELKKLGELCDISSGGTPSREVSEYWTGGTIPWVKTGEINYTLIKETSEKITELGLKNSSTKMFPAGTLLMAMYGQGITRGKVALLGIDATLNQACAAIIPFSEQEISSKYLYRYFEYQYEYIREFGHGANQKNLSGTIIKSIPVVFPKD
ncbi:MAG: restriction endonuclease subunit S, partial [Flavisolibacter sp.]